MLTINIPEREYFNDETDEFTKMKAVTLTLEHSLVSLAKWESIWHKPFLSKTVKTKAEIRDYVRCMIIDKNIAEEVVLSLTDDDLKKIHQYIDAPMTATTFTEAPGASKKTQITTAEIIYYWMVAHAIPFECQKWHLNRLLTLIRVCNIKNAPPKKMGKQAILRENSQLNAARKSQLNTKG